MWRAAGGFIAAQCQYGKKKWKTSRDIDILTMKSREIDLESWPRSAFGFTLRYADRQTPTSGSKAGTVPICWRKSNFSFLKARFLLPSRQNGNQKPPNGLVFCRA